MANIIYVPRSEVEKEISLNKGLMETYAHEPDTVEALEVEYKMLTELLTTNTGDVIPVDYDVFDFYTLPA